MIAEDSGFFCVRLVYWKLFVIYRITVKLDKNSKKTLSSVLLTIGYYAAKIIHTDTLSHSKWITSEIGSLAPIAIQNYR